MKMKKHTKIVATISDKQCDVPFLRELFNEGMNVVRLNSAHLDEKGIRKIVHNVREVSDRIALLVDTKGYGDTYHRYRKSHPAEDGRPGEHRE